MSPWKRCIKLLLYSALRHQAQDFKNLYLMETKIKSCLIYFTAELEECKIYKHYHTE